MVSGTGGPIALIRCQFKQHAISIVASGVGRKMIRNFHLRSSTAFFPHFLRAGGGREILDNVFNRLRVNKKLLPRVFFLVRRSKNVRLWNTRIVGCSYWDLKSRLFDLKAFQQSLEN